MRILHMLSPARLMRFVAGQESAGSAEGHPAFRSLNDHYLRDIGLRSEPALRSPMRTTSWR